MTQMQDINTVLLGYFDHVFFTSLVLGSYLLDLSSESHSAKQVYDSVTVWHNKSHYRLYLKSQEMNYNALPTSPLQLAGMYSCGP